MGVTERGEAAGPRFQAGTGILLPDRKEERFSLSGWGWD